jgi:acyl-CoA thioester hydrolase
MHYQYSFAPRWSDLDPNVHMRHSAYYDYGAQARMNILAENGFSMNVIQKEGYLPILFREEARFLREIKYTDTFVLSTKLIAASADFRKWNFEHQFIKQNGDVACKLIAEGAWMSIADRKVIAPSDTMQKVFAAVEKAEGFVVL